MQPPPLFQQSSQQPPHAQPPQQPPPHAQLSPQSQSLQQSQQPQPSQSSQSSQQSQLYQQPQQPQLYQQAQPAQQAQQAQQHTPEQVHSQIQIPPSVDLGQPGSSSGYFLGEIDPLGYVQQASSAAMSSRRSGFIGDIESKRHAQVLQKCQEILDTQVHKGRLTEQHQQELAEELRKVGGKIADLELMMVKQGTRIINAIQKLGEHNHEM
ncbi:uncharacterized protein B0I36DRAFT_347766 [Microdochium trichocladiopsis]|uniref:Uncharacterized protein n=1 Tax=Microdochium trichocladiopsis TaxID=1682393 RepID=A0A9P9BUS0_9PEZI|nr:uncharacterized protein B0I36DRAFT_347766 [Microdochium trichocladiopsis]KAH7032577.1 hypothetical protein B0I36DRAFT_347766 [Microdochium trichocladiopsis]